MPRKQKPTKTSQKRKIKIGKTKERADTQKIDLICQRALGEKIKTSRLFCSETNTVLWLTTQSGKKVILKLFSQKSRRNLTIEEEAIRIAKKNGIPVPQIFHADPRGKKGGIPFILMQEVSGELLATYFRRTGKGLFLYEDMGELLAKMHSIEPPLESGLKAVGNFRTHMTRKFTKGLSILKRRGVLSEKDIQKIKSRFNASLIINPERRTFLHGDYFGGQLLTDGKRITAVIEE